MAETFREALGFSESGGRYGIVNDEGYSGKYQWGPSRLADYNKAKGTNYTMDQFLSMPAVQEDAQAWHENDIMDYVINEGLDYYVDKDVAGVKMTPEAIKAMAHLGGKAGMKRFLTSGGEYNPQDSNGTSLLDYAAKFSGSTSGPAGAATGMPPMSGQQELTYGSAVEGGDPLEQLSTAYEMLQSSEPDFCPAGTLYDPLTGSCVPTTAPVSSPRARRRPERGAALENFGLSSLI